MEAEESDALGALLFTDLAGSIVEEFQGRVMQTTADSMLAEFPAPVSAARAAIEIQRRLLQPIGIHLGFAFDNAVNVTARIVKHTGPAQILISRGILDAIQTEPGFRCTPKGTVDQEEMFELAWSDSPSPKPSISPERWKEIEKLYNAALDQPLAARSAILSQAHPEVREVVRKMLSQNTQGEILDQPAWQRETATQTSAAPAIPLQDFGCYRIETAIGKGGMGDVFLAFDTRLSRKVVIKTIRTNLDSSNREGRFLEEARAASALNHPNIITIYDVGGVGEIPYIVMEWVDGQTLRQKLSNGPLSLPEILGFAMQIADALAAAHNGGILHRDLKPENIMVTTDARIKVLDFGIAKRLPAAGTSPAGIPELTVPGSVIGTPGYMSPEQARGENLDFRSDHFSFGAILYEMATGRRAFSGNSAAEVHAAILLLQPEPLTRVNQQIPAPFQWIVERCLAKSPQDRFPSTPELRRELTAIVDKDESRGSETKPIYNVPTPRTPLIGREDELTRLCELSADPDLRVLTLTGAGGIGKTRLAVELARQRADHFPGGVCFLPLERVSQAGLVPSEVIRALGAAQWPGQTVEAAIAEHLRRNTAGPLLLVLDNFEHVLESAAFVGQLASDRLKLIVTSRAPLRIYGEYEFPVPPLLSFDLAAGGGKMLSPAVRLFFERAPGLRGSNPTNEQKRIVFEICEKLDGLPLAIELAAARTKLLPLKTLLERLHDPLGLLVGGARDLPQRQHTLRATIDWSYNLLSAEHQKLLRRMAVFVGGATIDGIEAVADTRQDLQVNLWDAIEHLLDNSLIRRLSADDEEPRFTLLETMREYGLERLAEAGEDAYTRKAHAAYFMVRAEEAFPSLRRESSGKHALDAELGNIRAALSWLTESGEVEWGLRLMLSVALYFVSLRLATEALTRLRRLLALPGVERFPRLRNWGQYWEVDLCYEGMTDLKFNPFLDVWNRFEETSDREGMFYVAHRIGVSLQCADLPLARKWSERAVELARSEFSMEALAGSLSNLADLVKLNREYAYAQALYLEARDLFEKSGDKENAIWSLSHLADLYREQGNDAQARSIYQDALSKFRGLGVSHGVASCLHDLALLDMTEGKYLEAQRLCRECLRLYGPENKSELPRILESMAVVAIQTADPLRALTLAGAGAAIRDRFEVRAMGTQRAEIEQKIDAARRQVGEEAAAHWMRGWNMNVEELLGWATGEETEWRTSRKQ